MSSANKNFSSTSPAAPTGARNVTWQANHSTHTASAYVPPFGASGGSHAPGLVPDPGSTAGSTHYLREDGTWATPPGTNWVGGFAIEVNGLGLSDDYFVTVNYENGAPPAVSGTRTYLLSDEVPGFLVNDPNTIVIP